MDIGQRSSSIIDIFLQLARLPAWERLVRHPLYWPACLLAPWQLIELIASAVNFPSCWPHTFIAPQKTPTNSLQYLSAEISTANSQLLFVFGITRQVLQHEETQSDKWKSLKGKTRWPHQLAVRQKGCPANLANCAHLLVNWNTGMLSWKLSIDRLLHFSTLETWTERIDHSMSHKRAGKGS